MSSNEWSNEGGAAALAPGAPVLDARRLAVALGAALLLAVAFALRLAWLDAAAHIDELYHLLAAEGWLRTGVPAIADGVYDRALAFTALVALSLDAFGDTLAAARLPSVIAGTALVLALFVWTRHAANLTAAFAAALLLALSPLAVEVSQLARFYALHALAFWLAASAAWHAMDTRHGPRERLIIAALGLACALFALHLQDLTLIGGLGVALWLGGLSLPHAWRWIRAGGRTRLLAVAVLSGLGVGALLLLLASGVAEALLERYRYAPQWAEAFRDQAHFYHLHLLKQYPLFWPLTPLALLAGLAVWPRAAAFCATVFGTAFLVASFAAQKDARYLFYALPFLLALWGMGFAATIERLAAAALALVHAARGRALPALPARPTVWIVLAGVLGFMVLSSGAPARLLLDVATGDAPSGPGRVSPAWAKAAPALEPFLESADVVVVSNELAALRHLGRADVLVSGSRLSELRYAEFARDPRTGLTVIAGPDAFRDVVRCHGEGLIVLSAPDLAFEWGVPVATRAAIADTTAPVPLAGVEDVRAYRWRNGAAARADCPAGTGEGRGG